MYKTNINILVAKFFGSSVSFENEPLEAVLFQKWQYNINMGKELS